MNNESQESVLNDERRNQIIKWQKLIKLEAENWNLYRFFKGSQRNTGIYSQLAQAVASVYTVFIQKKGHTNI